MIAILQHEYDGDDNLLRKYIYGPGIDQPHSTSLRAGSSCMIKPVPDPIGDPDSPALSLSNGAVSYYHYDGLGSVVALSDEDGDTIQVYEYDVYGNVAASDPNHTNPFMFTGRRMDSETGLYFYRARYYNPSLGRFLQTDPEGYGDGINWYAYCANNPLNNADPSGLKAQPFCWFYYPDGTCGPDCCNPEYAATHSECGELVTYTSDPHGGTGLTPADLSYDLGSGAGADPVDWSDPVESGGGGDPPYFGTSGEWYFRFLLPDDVSDPQPLECKAIEGWYRHCMASCRMHRWALGSGPTYLIGLWYGDDWWWNDSDGDINHYYDRMAYRVGIRSARRMWASCRSQCRKSQARISAVVCDGSSPERCLTE